MKNRGKLLSKKSILVLTVLLVQPVLQKTPGFQTKNLINATVLIATVIPKK